MTGVSLEQEELGVGLSTPSAADLPPLPDESPDLEAFEQHLAETLREEDASPFGRWRSLPIKTQRIAWGLGALVAVAVSFFLSRRVDWDVYPVGRLALVLGVLSVAWVYAATRSNIPLDRPTRGPIAGASWVLLGLAVPLVFSLMPAAHADHSLSLAGVADDFIPRAVGCLVWGTLTALPATFIILATDRQPSRQRRILAGVIGGLLGNITLQLHCPLTSPMHLVTSHATVGLVLVLVGVGFVLIAARRSGRS